MAIPRLHVPLLEPEDVVRHLGKREKHWKEGRSAHALANVWSEFNALPPKVKAMLGSHSDFQAVELIDAFLERQVDLQSEGRPSQTDLLAVVGIGERLAVVAVEGKAGEPFGERVEEWLDGSTKKEKRLEGLCRILNLPRAAAMPLRYQLLHRSVSAIIEAHRYRTKIAVLLIHGFTDDPKGMADFTAFLKALGFQEQGLDILAGPELLDGVSLYAGWVRDKAPKGDGPSAYLDALDDYAATARSRVQARAGILQQSHDAETDEDRHEQPGARKENTKRHGPFPLCRETGFGHDSRVSGLYRRSSPARGDEARSLFQRGTLISERRECGFRLLDERLKARSRRLDPKQRDKRRLAAAGILGHSLTNRFFVAFGIEQIVGKLKRLPEGGGIGMKRFSRQFAGAAEHGASRAGKREQRAGLHRLHLGNLHRSERLALRRQVERLPSGHALHTGCLRQQADQLDPHAWIPMRAWAAQYIEGERLQRVAGKNRGRLAERDMRRGPAAPDRVVVHGGKIVMHQRVAMHAFERGGSVKSAFFRHAEQARGFDEQERSQALAAAERRVAHRLDQPSLA